MRIYSLLRVPCYCVLVSTALLGPKTQAVDTQHHFAHDFGEVSGTNKIFCQFNLGNNESEQVKTVFRTCGCTTISLNEGDTLPTNALLTLAISLEGKPFGKGKQVVDIEINKETNYHFELTYNNLPDPFPKPISVVFSSRMEKKQVQLFFPKEDDVKYVGQKSNSSLIIVTTAGGGPHFISLELALANNKTANLPEEGVLSLRTTSKIRPVIEIPYLIFEDRFR